MHFDQFVDFVIKEYFLLIGDKLNPLWFSVVKQ